MLEMILVSYGFLVWLVCIKLKLLPWNIKTQVGAVAGGIGIGASILLTINIVTPISHDVRAINFVAEIVPRVSGNVVRVAIEGNQLVKKGDVLLEIDPTPYRLKVKQLEAQVADATASAKTLWQDLDSAKSATTSAQAQLALMKKRLAQSQELALAGAGNVFDVESFATQVKISEAAVANAKAAEIKVMTQLEGVVGDDIAQVAQIKAQLPLNALHRGEVPVLEIDLLLPIEFMALDPEALQIFCEQDGTADFDKMLAHALFLDGGWMVPASVPSSPPLSY